MIGNMSNLSDPLKDAAQDNWVDRFAPSWICPYLKLSRLDRPIGSWLLLLPCWWGIALATPAGAWPDERLFFLFAMGAIIMRGAGCTFNDIVDFDYDARVDRTRLRPLPSGQVVPWQAATWLVAQLLVGLIILWQFNDLTFYLGLSSLLLIAIYPFMKRITWWPQFFLGLAFNWGAIMGTAATTDSVSFAALVLYVGGIAWTLGYDTIYALQDKEDDALIGVRSTARLFGKKTKNFLWVFYGITLAAFTYVAILTKLAWPYDLVLVVAACHFIWQIVTLRLDNPADSLQKFRANRDVGLLILAGIILGRWIML